MDLTEIWKVTSGTPKAEKLFQKSSAIANGRKRDT